MTRLKESMEALLRMGPAIMNDEDYADLGVQMPQNSMMQLFITLIPIVELSKLLPLFNDALIGINKGRFYRRFVLRRRIGNRDQMLCNRPYFREIR